MSVKVTNAGLLATIQDLGRYGLQKYGIIVGGAMDPLALRLANMLVGNKENEAAIEVTMFGTELYFENDHVVAITGADLEPKINRTTTAPMWRPFLMKKGDSLKFNNINSGSRAYLSISGGICVPSVMGSKSTYTQAKIGGYKGRALKEDDTLKIGKYSDQAKVLYKYLKREKTDLNWFIDYSYIYDVESSAEIRVLKGSEFHLFTESSQQAFLNSSFEISLNANRMGYQLDGEKLELSNRTELLSEGVTYGTIQVPNNGQPIILMVERQTIGGYPKIAQVITVDIPRLAQMSPKDTITFKVVSIKEAEELLMEREKRIYALKRSIAFKISLMNI